MKKIIFLVLAVSIILSGGFYAGYAVKSYLDNLNPLSLNPDELHSFATTLADSEVVEDKEVAVILMTLAGAMYAEETTELMLWNTTYSINAIGRLEKKINNAKGTM